MSAHALLCKMMILHVWVPPALVPCLPIKVGVTTIGSLTMLLWILRLFVFDPFESTMYPHE